MMISIKKLFDEMPKRIMDNQRKINVNTKVNIYYGLTRTGCKRISFLSSCRPYTIESTKLIEVQQINESDNVYWTCFDLVDSNAESVYFSLIEDLIWSIEKCNDELSCMKEIKNRFLIWRKMLGRVVTIGLSEEKTRGLYGELYFLFNYMIPHFGVDDSIKSWGGPDGDSKDFTINNSWYEIKAIGMNTNEVKISSIAQLDSDVKGDLAVIRIEGMSEAFSNGMSSIEELVTLIFNNIDALDTRELFISKLDKSKYSPLDSAVKEKFKAYDISLYLIDEKFPRLLGKDIKHAEIFNVTYSLYIKAIEKYKDVR